MDNNPYNGQQASSETSANTPVGQEGTTVSVPGGNVVADNPVLGDHPSQRILGRQIPSSASRGTQTMTGQTIVNDPSTNRPVITTSAIKQNTVFSDPKSQTPRVIEGLLPDGTYGMWVSKPGVDVTTTTTTGLIFNSNQDVFKIVQTGTTNITAPAVNNSNNITVNHNLGFTPTGLFYVNNSNQFVPLPWTLWGTLSNQGVAQLALYVASVDTTTITFQINNWNNLFTGSVYPIKYFLLQESVS